VVVSGARQKRQEKLRAPIVPVADEGGTDEIESIVIAFLFSNPHVTGIH
jgi:hypothetical protein